MTSPNERYSANKGRTEQQTTTSAARRSENCICPTPCEIFPCGCRDPCDPCLPFRIPPDFKEVSGFQAFSCQKGDCLEDAVIEYHTTEDRAFNICGRWLPGCAPRFVGPLVSLRRIQLCQQHAQDVIGEVCHVEAERHRRQQLRQ